MPSVNLDDGACEKGELDNRQLLAGLIRDVSLTTL